MPGWQRLHSRVRSQRLLTLSPGPPRRCRVPRLPIMEEFELVAKLRRRGAAGAGRIVTLPMACECDGRRWAASSIWSTNWCSAMAIHSPRRFIAIPLWAALVCVSQCCRRVVVSRSSVNQRCMIAYNFMGATADDIYRWCAAKLWSVPNWSFAVGILEIIHLGEHNEPVRPPSQVLRSRAAHSGNVAAADHQPS